MEAFEAARAKRSRRINGLADPDVLDCPVCFELLAPPVFQCENGHIACSSCRSRIDQCHSCDLPITIRNRAIEKVIESVKLACINAEYGCNETISYYQIYDHEETCQHAPCSCLFQTATSLVHPHSYTNTSQISIRIEQHSFGTINTSRLASSM